MAERGGRGSGGHGSLDKSITLPPDEIFRNLENAKRFAIDIGNRAGAAGGPGGPRQGGGGGGGTGGGSRPAEGTRRGPAAHRGAGLAGKCSPLRRLARCGVPEADYGSRQAARRGGRRGARRDLKSRYLAAARRGRGAALRVPACRARLLTGHGGDSLRDTPGLPLAAEGSPAG